jgi:hypothetical protein
LRGVHEISEMSWQLAIIILDEGDGLSFCEWLTFVKSWLYTSSSYLQPQFFQFNDVFRLANAYLWILMTW